ncbi:Deoxycytidylate deaminase, partial [Geodia barretti]
MSFASDERCNGMDTHSGPLLPDVETGDKDVAHKRACSSSLSSPLLKKRKDYLSWEDYFMAVAFLSAQRSKDPN